MARRRSPKKRGGGAAGNPNSLANLRDAPPAPPGNKRAERSGGAYGTIVLAPGSPALPLFEWLCRVTPYRGRDGVLPPQHQLAAETTAVALVRLKRAGLHLDEHGEFTRGGKVKAVADYERKLVGAVLNGLETLGLTPRAEAKLGLNIAQAVDAATAISHPDPDERRRLMAEAGLLDEGGDE